MKSDSLGDRMKNYYENRSRHYLTRRTPVIIRLDGKAFHTFTRHCLKPFDTHFAHAMDSTAHFLLCNIQGAKMAYVQSDEISILVTDFDKLETDAWFDYNIQKMCSVSAAMASTYFSVMGNPCPSHPQKLAYFDSRVFNIPKEEVVNYFRWRYMDWLRNSIQMLAQSLYSHKELAGKKKADLHEMCFQKGVNWADSPDRFKNGCFLFSKPDDIVMLDSMVATTPTFTAWVEPLYLYGKIEEQGSGKWCNE